LLSVLRVKSKGTSVVIFVVVTDFFSRSSIDVVLSKLEEVVQSFLLEKLCVSTELRERLEFFDFDKVGWHASGFPIVKVVFEKLNSVHSFIMFSDSGDEDEGSITSFVVKFFNQIFDFMESVLNILYIVMSIVNFLLDEFSVSDSVIVDISVGVHDLGQGTDFSCHSIDLSVVGDVKSASLIESRLSETVKDIHDGIDSVTGLFLKLEEFNHFVGRNHVEFGAAKSDADDE